MITLYIITGQTATGKTEYALQLAREINGELINCDSRQIYKNLDIITGKDLDVTDKKFQLYKKNRDFEIGYYQTLSQDSKIWLYDIVDPKLPFSTFDYNDCAFEAINDIIRRKKTPIIIGGTYFYLKQLLYGGITHAVEPDWNLRKILEKHSVKELQTILQKENNAQYQKLNNSEKNNPQRLIRWIEITRSPDKNSLPDNHKILSDILPDLQIKMIGITPPPKEELKKRIQKRVEKRLQTGAIDEVKKLLTNGYSGYDPGLKTIGYAQILKHIDGTISKDEMIREWITKEIQYAKRQLTFMKKDPHMEWIAI